MSQLTNRQRVFIEEYLTSWNATQSAIKAGYSPKTARVIGAENLTKPAIARAIEQRMRALTMKADEVLVRLSQQASGSIGDFLDEDGDLDKAKLASGPKAHLIKKFVVTERTVGKERYVRTEVELYDAQNALALLGKHHTLFTERMRVDDWRSDAIALIRDGKLSFDDLAAEFDHDLATELFRSAGVPVASA